MAWMSPLELQGSGICPRMTTQHFAQTPGEHNFSSFFQSLFPQGLSLGAYIYIYIYICIYTYIHLIYIYIYIYICISDVYMCICICICICKCMPQGLGPRGTNSGRNQRSCVLQGFGQNVGQSSQDRFRILGAQGETSKPYIHIYVFTCLHVYIYTEIYIYVHVCGLAVNPQAGTPQTKSL